MRHNGSEISSQADTSRQATLTSGASLTCAVPTSPDTINAISSPASAGGPSPSDSQAGPTTDLFGQEVAPASRSQLGAKSVALTMNATFGPTGFGSSERESLQSSLENRLRARLDTDGSPEFILKWSRRLIRSGRRICVLRASRRNTPGNASSLWRTPAARDWRDLSHTGKAYAAARTRHQPSTITLAYERGFVSSQIPELLCGLMGYPAPWFRLAVSATPSSRKSRPSSSRRRAKP